MLHSYKCEKCGQEFSTWEECYACENGHISSFSSLLDPETEKRMTYQPGCAAPSTLILATDHYDFESSKYVVDKTLWEYKLVGKVRKHEAEEIMSEYNKRKEKEAAWKAEYQERKEREKLAETAQG